MTHVRSLTSRSSSRPDRTIIRVTTPLHPTPAQNERLHQLLHLVRAVQQCLLAWYATGGLGGRGGPASLAVQSQARVHVPSVSVAHLVALVAQRFPDLPEPVLQGVASQVHTSTRPHHGKHVPAGHLPAGFPQVHVPLDASVQALGSTYVWIEGMTRPILADLWQLPLDLTHVLTQSGGVYQQGVQDRIQTMLSAATAAYAPALSDLDRTIQRCEGLHLAGTRPSLDDLPHRVMNLPQSRGTGLDLPGRVGHATLRQVTHPDGTPGWSVTWSIRVPHGWLPPATVDEPAGVDIGLRHVVTAVRGTQHWTAPGPPVPDLDVTGVSSLTSSLVRRAVFERQAQQLDDVLRALLTHRTIGIEDTRWAGLAAQAPERVRRMTLTGAAFVRPWLDALAPVTGSRVVPLPPVDSSHRCGLCDSTGTVTHWRFYCSSSACGHAEDADLNSARRFSRLAAGSGRS